MANLKDRTKVYLFWGSIAALVAIKLWLTSEIRVLPANAGHDSSNFIEHANSLLVGKWFGHYNHLTLIKGPGFPIYIALVQELGLPLPLAHQLLYAFASLTACFAINPLLRRRRAQLIVFAAVLWNPMTYSALSWVPYRSQLSESLSLFVISCAIAILVRRKSSPHQLTAWFAGLGISFAAFWLTREEGIWLVPSVAIIIAAYLWRSLGTSRRELFLRLESLALPVFIWSASISAIAAINGAVYGWYTTVEMQSPEFVSAYNSLARVAAPEVYHVPVPRAARELAYSVSPAARELMPALEGSLGQTWTQTTCQYWNVCGDIGGGWFMWAFRDSVALAGHYSTGENARDFYIRLARELDDACSSGKIRCRKKALTLMPPIEPGQIPDIVADEFVGLHYFATLAPFSLQHWPLPVYNYQLQRDYEFVTRSVETSQGGETFIGWLVHRRLRAIAVFDGDSIDWTSSILFKPSPDVYRAISRDPAGRGLETGVARFEITSPCTRCSLVVTDDLNGETRIPLNVGIPDFRKPGLIYHLDRISPAGGVFADFDAGFKARCLAAVALGYQVTLPYAIVAALLLTALRSARSIRRRSLPGDHVVLSVGVLVSGTFLLTILGLIDRTSFPAFNDEYMGGLYPILFFSLATTASIEVDAAYSVLRWPRKRRARLIAAGGVLMIATLAGTALLKRQPDTPLAPAAAAERSAGQSGHAYACTAPLASRAGIAHGYVDSVQLRGNNVDLGTTAVLDRSAVIVVRGWAGDASAQRPISGVCLTVDGEVLRQQSVTYGAARPDVASALHRPAMAETGYEIRAAAREIPAGSHRIAIVGVDAQRREQALGPGRLFTIR